MLAYPPKAKTNISFPFEIRNSWKFTYRHTSNVFRYAAFSVDIEPSGEKTEVDFLLLRDNSALQIAGEKLQCLELDTLSVIFSDNPISH